MLPNPNPNTRRPLSLLSTRSEVGTILDSAADIFTTTCGGVDGARQTEGGTCVWTYLRNISPCGTPPLPQPPRCQLLTTRRLQYGGGRRCQQEGCSKAAQGGTQDIAHGGGRPLPPRGLLQSLLELLVPAGSVCRVRSPMTHSRPHCKPQHVMHSRLKPLLESSTTCEDSRRADSKRSRSMCQVAAYIAAWALTSFRWHC
jgi:hypothetical protein